MHHRLTRQLRRIGRDFRAFFTAHPLEPLPIRRTFHNYDPRKFRADVRAGINVALLALPQGMAYAAIA